MSQSTKEWDSLDLQWEIIHLIQSNNGASSKILQKILELLMIYHIGHVYRIRMEQMIYLLMVSFQSLESLLTKLMKVFRLMLEFKENNIPNINMKKEFYYSHFLRLELLMLSRLMKNNAKLVLMMTLHMLMLRSQLLR